MADPVGEEDQRFDRWSRPAALSRRGYLIVVLVPFLIAAVGFGALTLFGSDEPELSGTTVRLPTSEWEPGQGGDAALIEGVLRMDDDFCVYLEQDGLDIYTVWPAGWRATREDGALRLYDANAKLVAVGGDTISTGGGSQPVGNFAGEPCLPETGDVAVVMDGVTVVPGGEE